MADEKVPRVGDWLCKKCGSRITLFACPVSLAEGGVCNGELVPCDEDTPPGDSAAAPNPEEPKEDATD